MHYYQFNIGDYASRTAHLEPLEDLAYRRMIDLYVKTESPLPEVQEIARLIRMRSHAECIESVLRDFFVKTDDGYVDSYIQGIVDKFKNKAEKAKKSAQARWNKESSNNGKNDDANALRTHCERYANHKPITNNHKPITINQEPIELPEWLDVELWNEYLVTRKKIKCINSPRALRTVLNKLVEFESMCKGDGNLALDEANANSWKSPYQPKKNQGFSKKPEEPKSTLRMM